MVVNTDILLSILVGIGLSAACGFRVFVPLLVLSIASLSGHVSLGSHFQWIGTYPAVIAFGVATVVEVLGYYIPWVDHLLDTIATPAAVVAGVVVSASMMGALDPYMRWTLAVIAGGGTAGVVQSGTVLARAASTATTGGLGNSVIATGEGVLAGLTSIFAVKFLIIPLIIILLMIGAGFFMAVMLIKKLRRASPKPVQG
jgi:hypothetical protein